jgi:hypothetical protein
MSTAKLIALIKSISGGGGGEGGGGYLKITIDEETGAMDKTWQEICDAIKAGYYVSNPAEDSLSGEISVFNITGTGKGPQDTYNVYVKTPDGDVIIFNADTASDYPVYVGE